MLRFTFTLLLASAAAFAATGETSRERISINDNWRFAQGDPNGDSTGLIYDVRPVSRGADQWEHLAENMNK